MKRLLFRVNAAFLMLVGAVQMVFELLGHFGSRGPFATILADSPYTIGFLEAHGLAIVVGTVLLVVAAREPRPFWHGLALAVHVLLGGANLLFFSSFVHFGLVPMGIAATAAHIAFVLAHAVSLVRISLEYIGRRTVGSF